MRDKTDLSDIDMFMKSRRGKAYLRKIVRMLKGRTVMEVSFSNEGRIIATTLSLNDGQTFSIFQPSLEAYALQEQFGDAIEEEYYKELDKQDKKKRKKP